MLYLDIMEVTEYNVYPMAKIDIRREIRQQQRQNSDLSFWIPILKGKKPPYRSKVSQSREHLILWRKFRNLKIIRWILYRIIEEHDERKQYYD